LTLFHHHKQRPTPFVGEAYCHRYFPIHFKPFLHLPKSSRGCVKTRAWLSNLTMNTLICLLSVALAEPPAQLLHCPESVAAKGDIKSGPALVHSFQLTNRGTGILTITRVEASCGCLRKSLKSGVLSPGETSLLTIEVNTLTQPAGQNRWQVTLGYKVEQAGAPVQTGEILLQLTATLTREIVVDPPQIGFSTTSGASHTITLTDSRAKPLSVLKTTSSSPHLVAEVGPRVDSASGEHKQTVSVKLKEDSPPGERDETIVLVTDDPAYPELRIPIRVLKRVPGAVSVSPESVAIRFGAGQTDISTLVQLRSIDGKPFSIQGAESDHPGVTMKWSKEQGTVAAVRITVTEAASAQSGNCKVRIKLGDAPGQEFVVPVSWIAAKKEK
jgi:hypothetical protein